MTEVVHTKSSDPVLVNDSQTAIPAAKFPGVEVVRTQQTDPQITLSPDRYRILSEKSFNDFKASVDEVMKRYDAANPNNNGNVGSYNAKVDATTQKLSDVFKASGFQPAYRANLMGALCGDQCPDRMLLNYAEDAGVAFWGGSGARFVSAQEKTTGEKFLVLDAASTVFAAPTDAYTGSRYELKRSLKPVGKAGIVVFKDQDRTIAFGPETRFDDSLGLQRPSEPKLVGVGDEVLNRTYAGFAIKDGVATRLTPEENKAFATKWGHLFSLNKN